MSKQRGKKVGFHEFNTQTKRHKVEIRLDTKTGEFFAEYNGLEFSGKDLSAMKRSITDEVTKRETIDWRPFIRIEVKGEERQQFSSDMWGVNTVGLDFMLMYIGEAGAERWQKRGHVYVDRQTGALRPECVSHDPTRQTERDTKKYAFIPYTDERWRNLTHIQDAINQLRKRLREVLVEAEPAVISQILDKVAFADSFRQFALGPKTK